MERDIIKRISFLLVLLILVILFGTVGYMTIEGMNFLDALYMTVITLATVGYREVKELDEEGKIFTIILIFSGFGVFTYSISEGIKIIIEGEINELIKERKMRRRIEKLKDHFIICGFGRMGSIIYKELKANNIPTVIIEKDRSVIPEGDDDINYIIGDATKDEILKRAGIERAKGLISVLSSEAENLYVVLTARDLNPNLFIVARAVDKANERKLKRAGADRVVLPYLIGGLRIAHLILRPTVVEFLEIATHSEYSDIQIEEIKVETGSFLVDKSIAQSKIREKTGVLILGIKRSNGQMEFNPKPDTVIKEGDILIVVGEPEKISELEKLAK